MAKSMLLGKVMTIGVRPTTGPLFWPMLHKAFAFLAWLIMVMEEHGVEVDHALLNRWVLKSGTHTHDSERPVADDRRIVPGTAILFVGGINPDVLRDLVYPSGKFATEPNFFCADSAPRPAALRRIA
jgi:hypothetical protein